MHITDISTLVSYTFWADMRLLKACARLSDADFIRVVSPDPGWHSVRGTLVHALDTAYGWRMALEGADETGILNETDFVDVASITQRWEAEQRAWHAYMAQLSNDELNAVWWSNGESSRTRWQTIMHVINDMTHHRSEVAAMLTGYGQSPGELDFDQYVVDFLPQLT